MSERPRWMDPNAAKATPIVRPQTQSYIKSPLPPQPSNPPVAQLKLPTVVTAGVGIIATLMMFLFFFWIAILVFGWVNPTDGDFGIVFASDYLTAARVILAAITSGIATSVVWSIAGNLVE